MRYRDWAPTPFDAKGAFLDADRMDWIVGPCSQTRDSDALDRSNFETLQKLLDDQGVEYEVHRFGHWGPGWIEIVLVHPDGTDHIDEIRRRLDDYPILDENDHSEREWNDAIETWECLNIRDRVDAIKRSGSNASIFAARRDEIPQDDNGSLYDWLRTP
jgi:hypothetical protein